jgi:zinc/manganese transport system permease protein
VEAMNLSKTMLLISSILVLLGALVSIFSPELVPLPWTIVMVSAAIAYGGLSPIVSARNLFFLGGSIPHTALLAASIGILLSNIVGWSVLGWSFVVGVFMIYIVGYLIYKGFEADKTTAIYVGTVASLTVLTLYYVSIHYPLLTSISSMILGDPLLAGKRGAVLSGVIAFLVILSLYLTYDEQIYIGLDSDYSRLVGLRVWAYDLLFYTLLGITGVGLLKIVGYILTHVFILLPGAIGSMLSKGSRETLYYSISLSIISSLVGLYVSVITNLSPSGTTGLVLVSLYILLFLSRR